MSPLLALLYSASRALRMFFFVACSFINESTFLRSKPFFSKAALIKRTSFSELRFFHRPPCGYLPTATISPNLFWAKTWAQKRTVINKRAFLIKQFVLKEQV